MTPTTTPTRLVTNLASPLAGLESDAWRDFSACAGHDQADVFFPVGQGPEAKELIAEAKAICRTCPVTEQCLRWALETRQDSGVWGGLSEKERRRFHGRRSSGNRPSGVSALEHILRNQLDEYLALEERGLEALEIARELGTNVQTVNRLRAAVAEQQGGTVVEVKAA